jgi:hypothetical protein
MGSGKALTRPYRAAAPLDDLSSAGRPQSTIVPRTNLSQPGTLMDPTITVAIEAEGDHATRSSAPGGTSPGYRDALPADGGNRAPG